MIETVEAFGDLKWSYAVRTQKENMSENLSVIYNGVLFIYLNSLILTMKKLGSPA